MQQDTIIKFCVVGEPGVGKTSMLHQYIHKKFDEKLKPTIGCDFSTKLKTTKTDQPVRLQLWDVAGQQRFTAVSKMYLRGAKGCVVVCSATQKNSIDETLKWKNIVSQHQQSEGHVQPQLPCLLVMNKCDLISPNSPLQFQDEKEMNEFAKKNGFCGFIRTSAKLNTNIDEVFHRLLDETISRGLVKAQKKVQSSTRKDQKIKLQKSSKKTSKDKDGGCC